MHAYNRIPSSGHSTPSPPQSPLRSPRYRHGSGGGGRSKPGRFTPSSYPPGRNLAHRLAWFLLSVLLRRQGIFLFAPLIYISGMLLYMGTVSFDVGPIIDHKPAPGSVYRSPQIYEKLRPEMDADNSSADALSTVWKNSYKSGEWRPCINKSSEGLPESNGYIYVEANGGLNQQRTSICNAVAVAGYLNATLLIPNFHYHSIWRDPSKFKDIYDEDYFISTLENIVRVVDKIPGYLMERYDNNMTNVHNFRVKAWAPVQYYRDVVLPRLLEERVIRISPFANRLSFDVPPAVQRLRCLANYEALRFSNPILTMGETLVARMKERSASHGGKYVSVHLRFEEDMVAFSCCVFDGGGQEAKDMKAARERGWKGKFTKPGRTIRPGAIRLNGKCPLTPLEVGLMLRGMGFDKNTYIFLASGKIYNSEKYMAPLLEMFPNLLTKDMLALEDELDPFKNYSSRMAAIDYTVCLHSEVFVTTQGGNFPHFLMGHRRFLYGGHSKTIRPDKRKLAMLFDNLKIDWKSFKRHMLNMRSHSDSKGFEIKRPNDSIYSFPCPDCMCHVNRTEDSRSSSAT
ncbi:protein ESMERALDA 1-like [Populus nigra]|uniref:protein ESMERALDA 1-like n=1 Tax=Populus nigra TaxID=3691 RepID=UPI002B27BF4B|nr:protein ESMERALDA 1-like [Populus nigra]